MKRESHRKILLDELERTGIIEIACKKAGIARATFYRWKQRNPKFESRADKALDLARDKFNDVAESKVLAGVMEGDGPSVRFYLGHNHPRYRIHRQPYLREKNKFAGFRVVTEQNPNVPPVYATKPPIGIDTRTTEEVEKSMGFYKESENGASK